MNIKTTKIYIIGPAGSGKSFLAKKLSNTEVRPRYSEKQLPILDLDDIFWKIKYIKENTSSKKQKLLQKFMLTNPANWIVEGAPKEFLKPVSKEATKIIWLNPNICTLVYRIIKRFIIVKITKCNNSKARPQCYYTKKTPPETWKSFYKLAKGIISYKSKNNLYYQHKECYILNASRTNKKR